MTMHQKSVKTCCLLFPRLSLACGGMAVNSVDDLTPDCLGEAGLVFESVLVSTARNWMTACIHTIIFTIVSTTVKSVLGFLMPCQLHRVTSGQGATLKKIRQQYITM